MTHEVRELLAVRACGRIDDQEIGVTGRVPQPVFVAGHTDNRRAVFGASIKPVEAGSLWVEIDQRDGRAFGREVRSDVGSQRTLAASTLRIHNHYVPHVALQGQCC